MKIGILTFHASHNYGSMLQAFALQETLRNWGGESEIINLRTAIQRSLIPPALQWKHPRSALLKLLTNPRQTLALQRKFRRFEKFLANDLRLTPALNNHSEVQTYIRDMGYDTLIAGSDQIWNPGCWDFDASYLLDFSFKHRRIAYAPSLGSFPEKMAGDKQSMLKRAWEKFDALSTREQRGSDFVEQLTGRKAEVVLDPTLLLDREQYAVLCGDKAIVPGPYIFYYTPREEPGTFRMAQLLAERLKMKIVVTQSSPEYVGDNIIPVYDCGPREFLNVISHARFTIGKSFHLLAFSLIFQKEFLMVSRDKDSRMMNILEPLHLTDRIISPDESGIDIPPKLDFRSIQTSMKEMRQSSLDFLRSALLQES